MTLLVHQVKPPFLDGRVSFSDIREAVPTVKDSSSDFAKMAREGSVTLRHLRENKEKHTMRQKFWELGGTRMGTAMGIKDEEQEAVGKEGGDVVSENAEGVSLDRMESPFTILCVVPPSPFAQVNSKLLFRRSTTRNRAGLPLMSKIRKTMARYQNSLSRNPFDNRENTSQCSLFVMNC